MVGEGPNDGGVGCLVSSGTNHNRRWNKRRKCLELNSSQDLNGDGRAEYLEVDPNTSAVTAYIKACPS